MARNTSVTIGEHYEKFIAAEIEAGTYGSASEIIREGLRFVEVQSVKRKALIAAIVEGENSGVAVGFSFENHLKELHKKYL